jgi:hypothetical protein
VVCLRRWVPPQRTPKVQLWNTLRSVLSGGIEVHGFAFATCGESPHLRRGTMQRSVRPGNRSVLAGVGFRWCGVVPSSILMLTENDGN